MNVFIMFCVVFRVGMCVGFMVCVRLSVLSEDCRLGIVLMGLLIIWLMIEIGN